MNEIEQEEHDIIIHNKNVCGLQQAYTAETKATVTQGIQLFVSIMNFRKKNEEHRR
jgi:hypothetical protein